jgi:hypothetical protein
VVRHDVAIARLSPISWVTLRATSKDVAAANAELGLFIDQGRGLGALQRARATGSPKAAKTRAIALIA